MIIRLSLIHVVNTSAVHQKRVRPLFFLLLHCAPCWMNQPLKLFLSSFCFITSSEPLFLLLFLSESTIPSQHWSSVNSTRRTFVPSTTNIEYFMTASGLSQRCLFSWAQRSTLSPREHKSTRCCCRASHCSVSVQQQHRQETWHFNGSHCSHFFQLMEDQILQKYRKYKKVHFFSSLLLIKHHNFYN